MTNPRVAFIALSAAFGLAVTFAAITTTKQIVATHAHATSSRML